MDIFRKARGRWALKCFLISYVSSTNAVSPVGLEIDIVSKADDFYCYLSDFFFNISFMLVIYLNSNVKIMELK